MKKKLRRWSAGVVSLLCFTIADSSQAQISGDEFSSTKVSRSSDSQHFVITGGSLNRGNLFHSFYRFSVPSDGTAYFKNTHGIKNIISQVTGDSISNIDGLIRSRGSANLLLINPNGIVFGANAQLDVGGSFLASTASEINFTDESFLSAVDDQNAPLLKIDSSIGLQFRKKAGDIVIQSPLNALEVNPSETLALIGGNVYVNEGSLTAPGGRIEVGSVNGPSRINLLNINESWNLEYEDAQNLGEIRFFSTVIDTTGVNASGSIRLKGRQITITGNSQIGYLNEGGSQGGNIEVEASESVDVNGSMLFTNNTSTGTAGDIKIKTKKLSIRDGSLIDASSFSSGQGGDVIIEASEIAVDGNGFFTSVAANTFESGDAGQVKITAQRLVLSDGGRITTSTADVGEGGAIIINVEETVEISGQGSLDTGDVDASGLFSETAGGFAEGSGGNLSVNANRIVVRNGGKISVAVEGGSTGQAGSLDLNASESLEVAGADTLVRAESTTPVSAGDLSINTPRLIVRDGAEVSVSNLGEGRAGNLKVSARSIELNRGTLTAETTSGDGGNINLELQDQLLLRNNSLISTTAGTEGAGGDGGDITIDTDLLVAVPSENSDIRANAFNGDGGNITITAQGIFGIEKREEDNPLLNDITASSEFGLDGIVEINNPETELDEERVELPKEVINVASIIDQNLCASRGGSSEFSITGRGGLPKSPGSVFSPDDTWEDWRTEENEPSVTPPTESVQSTPSQLQGTPEKVIEAQGWVRNANGNMILTAQSNMTTPQGIAPPQGCQHLVGGRQEKSSVVSN